MGNRALARILTVGKILRMLRKQAVRYQFIHADIPSYLIVSAAVGRITYEDIALLFNIPGDAAAAAVARRESGFLRIVKIGIDFNRCRLWYYR